MQMSPSKLTSILPARQVQPPSASLSAVRRQYRSADWRCGVADKECDHAGDRLRRDRVRHRLLRERGPVCGGIEQLGRDRVHPDPVRAELYVEDACQVDESGLARAVGGHAAGWLDPRRAATCTMAPEPCCCMCGATAWLSHSAGPRLTSIMSRSVSGVVVSASPGRNAPMVFTSTSGGPTSPAIRSMRLFAAAGSVVSATSRRTP